MFDEYLIHTCDLYTLPTTDEYGKITADGLVSNVRCRIALESGQRVLPDGQTYVSAGTIHFNGDQTIKSGMMIEYNSQKYFITEASETPDLESSRIVLQYAYLTRQPNI